MVEGDWTRGLCVFQAQVSGGLQRRLNYTGLCVHSTSVPGKAAAINLPGRLLGSAARRQSAMEPSRTQGPRALSKLLGHSKRPTMHVSGH